MQGYSEAGGNILSNQERSVGKTDAEFLQRLKEGDERAWEQLLDRWQGPLFRYLSYSLPNAESAQDVLGETLIGVVKGIQRFDGKVALSTFIYSIASRKVADYWRKHKKTTSIPETLSVRGPDSDNIEFREVLDGLQSEYRDVLLLRYHMGMSVSEIADIMGKTYKATESLLSRGRSKLRTALEGAGIR